MKKILGLDLGTNSIGWALVEQDFENKKGKILGMGSRIIPMGTDKQDYEKGVGITKNAERRAKRTIRKMNKRYKLRRNKLLFILNELDMLPEQFQFKNGLPEATKLQELELLPIKRGTLQLDSLQHYKLKSNALEGKESITLKEFGKILYSFNQLRGYAGGNNDEGKKKKKEDIDIDENESIKKYEVFNQIVTIQKVEQSETKFRGRGKNKGQEFNKYNVTVLRDGNKLEGETELQNLAEKINQVEELEIRIRRNKKGEITSIAFSLPQKTNWRKQMEEFENEMNKSGNYISQEILKALQENKWRKIRNRVILRHRYQMEFDKIWETQCAKFSILNNCPKETIEKIASYLFPGKSESQENFRKAAIEGGLKYIIKDQIIYYQRPLKSQTELISNCKFEKEEKVLAISHPLFQEFRCWDQINKMYITSKQEVYNEKKKKNIFQYTDRFLTNIEKQEIYNRLQVQKQLSFSEVAKITNLKNDKTEYLNGLNEKAKLKGCDTKIDIKKKLGEHFDTIYVNEKNIIENIWKAIFENANNGSEYDPNSLIVKSVKDVLNSLNNDTLATELALKLVQNIKYPRKFASLSAKAINNILPLMQLNPINVLDKVKQTFNLIQTGEITNDLIIAQLEDYVISFIEQNPKAMETGGLMYAFACSLVYGKHTQETIQAQIKDYHEIKYKNRNLRNPIVEQITNETMQVIKAIWKQYKLRPEDLEIKIELARDLKNSAVERDKIYKGQIKSQKINESIKQKLAELKQELNQKNIELYKLWSNQNKEAYPLPKKATEPTPEEIQKLRLWEEQSCISPYTLKPIPLSKLFSPERLYDKDHIIPKSRFFDNSLTNQVICETHINEEKSNRTAWEYISQQSSKYKNRDGSLEICTIENYINHINQIFYGKKKKNLLLEKIPTNPVERQLKNTQYVTVAVKNELAKIVGSDNIKISTGEITDFLRSRWGLRDLFMKLTQERFKQMELWDINPKTGKPNNEWVKTVFDENKNKDVLRIKNWNKRYDHRHHAIDALVVALTKQSHIQRLNNLNKYLQDELIKRKEEFKLEVKENETIIEAFFNLEEKRRKEIQKQIESSRFFEKPFEDITKQAKILLETMVVSVKSKDKLGLQTDKEGKLIINNGKKQLKIRGALHQETYYGKLNGKDTKTMEISKLSTKDISKIIDKNLSKEIDEHRKNYESIKEALTGEGLKTFNESRFQTKNPTLLKPPVYKVKIWYSAKKENQESTLQRLYDRNDKLSVITGDNYLFIVMEKNGKRIFDIASLYDSAILAKEALKNNENMKQRICEDFRFKHKDKPDKVLFTLQQNDLVYLPEKVEDPFNELGNDEFKKWLQDSENKKKFCNRIYKVVMFSGKDCKFIPHNYANTISIFKDLTEEQKLNLKKKHEDKKGIPKNELCFVEFGSYRDCSPFESGEVFIKSLTSDKKNKEAKPLKIQDTCIKLQIDWLGNISKA